MLWLLLAKGVKELVDGRNNQKGYEVGPMKASMLNSFRAYLSAS